MSLALSTHKYSTLVALHTDISNAHINNKDTHLMVSPYHSGTMLDLLELKMKEMVKTTGVKTCKAPVKSSPPTTFSFFYRPDALPVTQPTVSKH